MVHVDARDYALKIRRHDVWLASAGQYRFHSKFD
jgi:hypothetical protein